MLISLVLVVVTWKDVVVSSNQLQILINSLHERTFGYNIMISSVPNPRLLVGSSKDAYYRDSSLSMITEMEGTQRSTRIKSNPTTY